MQKTRLHYREQREYGDSLYPVKAYRFQHDLLQKAIPQLCVSYHWHPELEIILVEKGKLQVYIESEEYAVSEGELLFINSSLLHSMYAVPHQYTQYTALVFDLGILTFQMYDYVQSHQISPLLSGKLKFPVFLSSATPCLEEIRCHFQKIIAAYEQQTDFYQFETKMELYAILLTMFRQHLFIRESDRSSALSNEQISQLKGILSYIAEHYQEKIMLEDIANTFHLSPKYFSRYFKRQFGQSFTEFLNAYRIEQSLKLLEKEKCSISNAALSSGFESLSYYVKVFKNVMGITPGEYRKNT